MQEQGTLLSVELRLWNFVSWALGNLTHAPCPKTPSRKWRGVFYRTEFRSQESEWAKRPAIHVQNEFCATGG